MDGNGLIPAEWNFGGKEHPESGRRARGAGQQRQRCPAATYEGKYSEAGGVGRSEYGPSVQRARGDRIIAEACCDRAYGILATGERFIQRRILR
jgi:hypothetical protein